MNKKNEGLIGLFMPRPVEWLLIGILFVFFWINPFHIIDRAFELAEKDTIYGIGINIAAFVVCLPFYLRMRKKLHKYQEDKWDDK